MKKNNSGIKRVMVILMCMMLVMSNMGTTAFALETAENAAGAEEAYEEGDSISASEVFPEVGMDTTALEEAEPEEADAEETASEEADAQKEDELSGAEERSGESSDVGQNTDEGINAGEDQDEEQESDDSITEEIPAAETSDRSTAVNSAEEEPTGDTDRGDYDQGDPDQDGISTWDELYEAFNDPKIGTIKLSRDIKWDENASAGALVVGVLRKFTLDLNGFSIDRGLTDADALANGYVIRIYGDLTIIDSTVDDSITDGTAGGSITGGNCSGNGGGIYNQGGLILRGVSITGNKAQNGGGVYNTGNGAVRILSGNISDNYAGSNGQNVYSMGQLTIKGGEISGSGSDCIYVDNYGSFKMDAGEISCEQGYSVIVKYHSSFTMDGGTIRNNKNCGINVDNGTLILDGGSITGSSEYGVMVNNGGSFNMHKGAISGEHVFGVVLSESEFTMDGGSISTSKGGVFMMNNSEFILAGGEISGSDEEYTGVLAAMQSRFEMRGGAILCEGANGVEISSSEFGLYSGTISGAIALGTGTVVEIGEVLNEAARYFVKKEETGVITRGLRGKGSAENFVIEDDRFVIVQNSDGEAEQIGAWSSLQIMIDNAQNGDTITLKRNYTALAAADTALNVPSGKTITIDLAGYLLDRNLHDNPKENGQVIMNEGDLTITDSKGGGVITGGSVSGSGAERVRPDENKVPHYEINSYNGGGGIYNKGTLRLVGGSIAGNSAGSGFNGGTADFGFGGGIFNEGTLTIAGGSITSNKVSGTGGGIYNSPGGEVIMTGGAVKMNTALITATFEWSCVPPIGSGAGIYNRGTLTVSGGEIISNEADAWGGGIYLPDESGAALHLTGGMITANRCEEDGGGVYVSEPASVTASGGPVVSGNTNGTSINNVNLSGSALIQVTGVLEDEADLGVTGRSDTDVVTSGYSTYNGTDSPERYFHSDRSQYGPVLRNGEVCFVEASRNVSYVDRSEDREGEEKTRALAILVPSNGQMAGGWYYLNSNVTVSGRVSVTGDTNLILGDGSMLDVKGLYVQEGVTLTIYGQSGDSGQIYSHPDAGAGIGAYSGHQAGEIIIHGGTIEAFGGAYSAGIGSSDSNGGGSNGTTGNIVIYGGNVTATGGSNSAGIGGGRYCDAGSILIYGGNVTAVGKGNSAGIGGGEPGNGHNGNGGVIRITGGTVNATGSGGGAGIGGSQNGSAQIYIEGGVINAGSGSGGVGIGNGAGVPASGASGETVTYLSWTDASKDTISITASSFKGKVNLDNSFWNEVQIFNSGSAVDGSETISNLAVGTLTAWDGEITSWAELQRTINLTGERGVYQLSSDITAMGTDTCLEIPSGKDIELDLNGFTIDRNLGDETEGISGGAVFHVQDGAILTIYDYDASGNGGIIKGGNNADEGGGILNEGSLYLDGVTIRDCAARAGGGVYVKSGTLYIDGNTVVTDNTAENGDNIVLIDPDKLSIFRRLDGSARVGVTLWSNTDNTAVPGVITSGLKNKGSAANFISDDSRFVVALNDDGEAELAARKECLINGVTGSFNDRIKLNYYFDFPADVLDDDDACVTITNENAGRTEELRIKEAELVEGKGYKFSIELNAKEASDTIIAKAFDGQGNAIKITGKVSGDDYTEDGVQYSLMEYFTWLEGNGSDEEKAVGAAAKDYCSAAQIYFGYNTEGLEVSGEVKSLDAEELSSYIAGRSGGLPDGVSIKGISAMLESDNTLRLYFDLSDDVPDDLTFAIDGANADLKTRGDGLRYLALDPGSKGSWSNELQIAHSYTVSGGGKTYTITASVLTYARSCAVKSDEKVANLGKALYLYNRAAVTAFGG